MPFCWEEDAGAEAEGVVVVVDVTRHARQVGLEGSTFVSRGLWVRLVGAGAGQEQRLVDTLTAAQREMANPTSSDEGGTALLFALPGGGAEPAVEVVSVLNAERTSLTFMLWREFTRSSAGQPLRVRVVAEDDTRARA